MNKYTKSHLDESEKFYNEFELNCCPFCGSKKIKGIFILFCDICSNWFGVQDLKTEKETPIFKRSKNDKKIY